MGEYVNRSTVMHLELSNCTVINRGTIMHLDGCANQIENRGTIVHNEGGRVVVMGSGVSQQQPQVKEKIVYRDRVVYKDRTVYKTNNAEVEKLQHQVQQLQSQIRSSEDARYTHQLENKINFYESRNAELKREIDSLKEELENTSRTRLLKQIEDLKESIRRSENRERVSRDQQYKKGYQAGVADGSNRKKEVFDWGVRPSKEQAEKLLNQLKVWLDCED